MTTSDVLFVPEMSQDPRVRVYRGKRVRTYQSNLPESTAFDGTEVDSYLLLTEAFILVCDTMIRPEDMAILIKSIDNEAGKRPLLVLNSHADWDHCWGNAYFTGERIAPIVGHEYSRTRLLQLEREQSRLTEYKHNHPGFFQNVALVPPTITFQNTHSLYGGDLTVKLIHTPGHRQDHIVAWMPEIRLLLAFDAAENPIPIIENATTVTEMFKTLELCLSLQPERVLCSHGRTTSPTIVQANLNYFREIERRCRVYLANHNPDQNALETASLLINYSFDTVVKEVAKLIKIPDDLDTAFYNEVHNDNSRYVLEWLQNTIKS